MFDSLPQLNGDLWLTDGGLETTLIFHHDVDLPMFAAFPLLDTEAGRRHLHAYFEPFLEAASRNGHGFVLDTPTWRASRDWGAELGYDAPALEALNRRSVEFARTMASGTEVATVVNGVIGPRADGYVVGEAMTFPEAARFHRLQARAFAAAGADMITAVTMTYSAEGTGVVLAAREEGLPVAVSFTVETDGQLPSGQSLADAIAAVEAVTDGYPTYYMVNCAHPSHFGSVLERGGPSIGRIRGIRANASRASHAELDQATELDRGDPSELAADYRRLRQAIPGLAVVGGCCGTDVEHVERIARSLAVA